MSNHLQDQQLRYGGVVQASEIPSGQPGVDAYPSTAKCVTEADRPSGNSGLTNSARKIYLPSCISDADFYLWESSDQKTGLVGGIGTANDDLTFSQQGGEVKFAIDHIKSSLTSPAAQANLKFVLVGHSMGGLAARHYLQNLHRAGANFAGDVSKLITVGTPHQGAFVAGLCSIIDHSQQAGLAACTSSLKASIAAIVGLESISSAATATGKCVALIAVNETCGKASVARLDAVPGGAIEIMNDCAKGGVKGLCTYPAVSAGVSHQLPSSVSYTTLSVGGGTGFDLTPFADATDGLVTRAAQQYPIGLVGVIPLNFDMPNIPASWLAHVDETADPNVMCVIAGQIGRPCLALAAGSSKNATTTTVNVSAKVASYNSAGGNTAVDAYFEYGPSLTTLNQRIDAASLLVPNSATVATNFAATLTFPASVAGQTIYWRACAISIAAAPNGACSRLQAYVMPGASLASGQTSANLLLPAPQNLLPNTTNAVAVPLTPTWGSVANATSYRVMISKSSDAGSLPVAADASDCAVCVFYGTSEVNAISLPVDLLQPGQSYAWQVKARNIEQYGAWSSKATLAVAAPSLLAAPTLTAPVDAAVVANSDAPLSWQAVSGATSYRVLVARTASDLNLSPDDSNCPGCVFNGISYSLSQTLAVSSLVAGETYFWRVKARNASQYGNLSSIRSFTVGQPSAVCSNSFPSAALAVPASGGVFSVAVNGREGCSVAVSVSPNQPYCTISNQPATFNASGLASVTLTVSANAGSTSRSCTLTAGTATHSVTQASPNPATMFTLSLTSTVGAWQLYVDDGTGSWTFDGSDFRSIAQGTTTKVTAAAQPGYVFTGWYDNSTNTLLSTAETYTFAMGGAARTLRAQFATSSSYYVYTGGANVPDGITDDVLWRVTASGMSTWDWQRYAETVAVPSTAADFRVDCVDTPFASPSPALFTQGNGYNPNGYWFTCNYTSKGAARLNLGMRPQAKIAVTPMNALVTLNDGRAVVWGSSSMTSFPNYAAGAIALGWGTRDYILTKPLFVDITNASGVDASEASGSVGRLAVKTTPGWKEWNSTTTGPFTPADAPNLSDVVLRRQNVSVRQGGRIFNGGMYVATIPTAVDAVKAPSGVYVLRSDGAVVYVPSDLSLSGCSVRGINQSATSRCVGITPLPELNGVIAIAANNTNSYAVRNDGTVWVWGYATIVNGVTLPVPGIATRAAGEYRPVQVPGVSGAVDVVTSSNGATYVRTASGQVYSWGDNTDGRVGLPTTASTADIWTPHLISGLSGIREIATSPSTNGALIAVDNAGFVWIVGLLQGWSSKTAGTGGELTELSTPARVLCPNGFTGFLNIDDFSANCTQSNNLTLNISATFANVGVLVNGVPVGLPYTGTFVRGQTVRIEALPEVGFGAFWSGNLYSLQRVLDVPMTRDWSLEVRQGACGSLTLLPPATNGSQIVSLTSGAGGQTTVQVYEGSTSATCHWKFETSTDWLSASGEGYGRGSFVLNYGANPTSASRTGYFKLIGANGTATERMVTQPAGTPDGVPNAFSFTTQIAVPRAALTQSEGIAISGTNAPATVSVSSGSEYSVGCTGTFTSTNGTISNGQSICVRHTSSANYATNTVSTLTIGGVSGTFTSVTLVAPVNGACGSANGVAVASAPTNNLCSTGYTSAVTSGASWTWTCYGSGAGTNASCSAPILDTTPPTAPTNLAASGVTATGATLLWNASTDAGGSGLAGYRLERCSGAGCTNFVQIWSGTGTSYIDTGLSATTTYLYRVRSYDGADNNSPYSNVLTVQTLASGVGPKNVAASLNGGVASASSTVLADTNPTMFPPSSAIDGDRGTTNWGSGGGWADGYPRSPGVSVASPSWLQSTFTGTKTIDRIDVITVADNYGSAGPPTSAALFSLYGLTDYKVQYWSGGVWQDVASVAGNRCVWKTLTFAPVTTTAVRVLAMGAPDGAARIAEFEAWEVGATTVANPVSTCAATAWTVTATTMATGSVTPASQTVASGNTASVTFTPPNGYSISTVNTTCGGTLVGNVFTTGPVTANCSLHALFAQISTPVNGVCGGASQGVFTLPPTTDLCATGVASALSGNGPWTWTCSGSNGGTNATCSTQVAASCVVNPIALNSTVTATLAPGCISSNRTGNNAGAYAKFYSFTLSVPTTVTISLAGAMDTYLYLLQGASVGGAVIASDDDGLGSLNSRIVATNLAPGTYTIEATTYLPSVAGDISVSLAGAAPPTTTCSATGRMLGKWRAYGTATYAGGNYVVGDSIGYGDQNDVDGDCNPFNTWWYGSPSGGNGGDSDILVYTPPALGAPIDMSWTGCLGATQNGYQSVGIIGKNLAFTGLPNSQQSPWTGDFEAAISTRGPTSGLWVVGPDASGASAHFALPGATLANGAYCADFRIVSSATSRAVFMNGSLVYSAPPAPAAVRMVVVSAFDAPVTLNNLQFAPASSACSLDLTADGVTSVTDDGLLINRYLMGFRGDALTAGISLQPWRSNAIAIEEAIGDGACFDVLARWGGAPSALVDGLILSRLMLGVPDDTLLNGITMPWGAGYSTASSIRAYVNSKFGTTF